MKKSKEKMLVPIYINMNSCDGCGFCADVCPKNIFKMQKISDEEKLKLSFWGKLKVNIKGDIKSYANNLDDCISCGKCVYNCHERAIYIRSLKKRA